jgi:hypothetical protein
MIRTFLREPWSSGKGRRLMIKRSWVQTGTVYWMDVSNASYYIHENNENKGSRMGHTKKKIKIKSFLLCGPNWKVSLTQLWEPLE